MSQSIFKNPYVSSAPALTGSSVGNGTLTVDRLTHFTINQNYTVICSAIAPFTVFNVIGSLDGAVGVAIVGQQYTDEDNKIFITIQQGPSLFQIGDTFEFSVAQGTDLNQGNLDLFDEQPQKNFGLGITGLLKGDHNIRFSAAPAKATKIIGDLRFTAENTGPEGNQTSIEYVQGSVLTPASLALQGLTFTANNAGEAGNDITVEFQEMMLAQPAQLFLQDIGYTADVPGTAGNLISIQYIGGGTQGFEVVTVVGNAITVQIEDGVSTSDDIEVALALSMDASALIDTGGTGETGAEPQYVTGSPQFLTGGTDQTDDAVEVDGLNIIIRFESNVTTLQEILDNIEASAPAMSLVTTTITGVPENSAVAPVAPTNLSGGSEDVGVPGSEVVVVSGQQITVSFVNGLSTAQQIKTAIEANTQAAALVDILLLGTGSEFQTSPVARTFLAGGRSGGSFAFNTDELSDPTNFYEGNAPINHTGQLNQGDELTLGETVKKGKVTLDDDVPANNPGPAVNNLQQTINNIIQNDKLFLKTDDNSKVDWHKPNLSFEADILVVLPESGIINRILVAQSPIVIDDGEHAYVTLSRLANANVTVTVASSVPTGENVLRLFSRIGDDLIWYDNTLQRDTKKIRIGEGGGGGTGYQEKIGTGNGVATTFPLTFIPSNEFSIIVICSYIRGITEYTYDMNANTIVFTSAPAAGQDVYVFYLTDGETITVPSPDGLLNSYVHEVTSLEEAAKEIVLSNTPAVPSKVLVDVIGGGSQEYNVDFNISTNLFQWAGFGLDGDLIAGDKVRFYFFS